MTASADRRFIGKKITDLPTPCALVDEAALEHNLNLMADYFARRQCKLRPHFKSHKCVTLAKKQLAAGSAVGITCAKLSEAEVLVAGGVCDVLIANQVVGPDKAERLAQLLRRATVRVCVDAEKNVLELARAAEAGGVEIGCLVEVDIGMGRCGVPPGDPALKLARFIERTRGVRLDGLQGYEGHLVFLSEEEGRTKAVTDSINLLTDTAQFIRAAGLPVNIVSGGGTGTYDVTGSIEGMNEVQAGSYALMDSWYASIRPEFRNALTVLATVISAPRPGRATLDVGVKGVGAEFGPPLLADRPEAQIKKFRTEEHTVVHNIRADVGEKLRLIPSHGCTTCNLHRRLFIHRDNIVTDVWPVEGSGCLE